MMGKGLCQVWDLKYNTQDLWGERQEGLQIVLWPLHIHTGNKLGAIKRLTLWGWRDHSTIHMCCSCTGPKFSSQHPCQKLTTTSHSSSISLIPGQASTGTNTYMVHVYTHIHTQTIFKINSASTNNTKHFSILICRLCMLNLNEFIEQTSQQE